MITNSLYIMLCIFISSPTTYNPEIKPPKRVRWPMKFGSPDWAQVPCLQKKTLRAEVIGLDFSGVLYLILPCVSVILNQESVNKLQLSPCSPEITSTILCIYIWEFFWRVTQFH